ncbi:MAG: DNA polymerase III subunit delta [Deltaproteobacteria bacterium]|nr:DNA polymerase III subunit delta [Deltaproteobacteria bacterium]
MALKPVYYFFGTDDYLMEDAFEKIRKEALTGGFASMNYHVYEGKTLDAGELVSTASTMPAFAEWRLVVVKGAESLKAAQEKILAEYVKDPSPTTCLVFISLDAKADRSSAFIKTLDEKGFLKACNRLGDNELLRWIKEDAAKQGKKVSASAAAKLLQTSGNRLRDIKGELDKIVLFVGDKEEIDDKDVEESGLDCREESIFNLSDAIGKKDVKAAFRVYERVSDEEPIKILGAISRQMRTLLKIKSFLRKGEPASKLPSLVGLFPKHADDYVRRSRLFAEVELIEAISKLAKADTDFKTGRAPVAVVLPRLIMELCGKG